MRWMLFASTVLTPLTASARDGAVWWYCHRKREPIGVLSVDVEKMEMLKEVMLKLLRGGWS